MVKRAKLPAIYDVNMKAFLKNEMRDKGPSSNNLGINAFRNWQDYLNHRSLHEPITAKDVLHFISRLEDVRQAKLRTIANYLGQLEPFFRLERLEEAANTANYQKNLLLEKAKDENTYRPIRIIDLQKIYDKAKSKGKVIIRLLLFEKVGIRKIAHLHTSKGNDGYHFWFGETAVKVKNKDTIFLADQLIGMVEEPFFNNETGVTNYIKELSQPELHYEVKATT